MRISLGFGLVAAFVAGCGTQQSKNERKGENRPAGLRDSCASSIDPTFGLVEPEVDENALALVQRLNRGLPDGLTARMVSSDVSVGARHYDFRYESAEGLPLCEHVVRAHVVGERTMIDGELSLASLPVVVSLKGLVWLEAEASARAAARSIGLGKAKLDLRDADRCFVFGANGPEAAWELAFRANARPYVATANGDRVLRIESQSLQATGSAKVFDTGPVGGNLVEVPLEGLLPGEGLVSARFKSEVASGPLALEPSRIYDYAPSDPRFAEVSAFAHVTQMAQWLTRPEHHYQIDCVPITVKTHVVFENDDGTTTVNNAEYEQPARMGDGFPAIWVGDGDGQGLQNLATDFDTVAHELGHHVVFRKLTSTRGTSAVLHEGLADFLVFAKTGNACLGESICPAGSQACEVVGQCLRTGENRLNFQDEDLPYQAHIRSQLVSGMLWDLGQHPDVGLETVATLVIKGIDYLLPASDYGDLVKALMAADLELFDGAHACRVREAAVARGFGDLLADVDCSTYEKTRR